MNLELYQITLSLALLMLGLEIFTGTLVFLGFAIGLLIVGVTHWMTGEFSISRDCIIFAITSLLSFIALRKLFHHKGDIQKNNKDVNQY